MSNQIESTIFGVCENNSDMIEVCGDYTSFYNENDNSLEDCKILKFEGMNIESIDEESLILEIVEDNWYVEDLDSLGNIDYHLDAEKLKSILGKIDVESAIEHLQEMGKVVIGNCDVEELQEALEEKGYITELDIKDRDYLILVDTIISLEEVCEDLLYTEVEAGEIENNIVEQFGNYQFKGESKIIVSKAQISGYDYIAYADHKDSPQVGIKIEDNEIIKAEIL
jgi:hypothetical protein